eukprot:999630-Pelagomonas_calceolata.AAC.1
MNLKLQMLDWSSLQGSLLLTLCLSLQLRSMFQCKQVYAHPIGGCKDLLGLHSIPSTLFPFLSAYLSGSTHFLPFALPPQQSSCVCQKAAHLRLLGYPPPSLCIGIQQRCTQLALHVPTSLPMPTTNSRCHSTPAAHQQTSLHRRTAAARARIHWSSPCTGGSAPECPPSGCWAPPNRPAPALPGRLLHTPVLCLHAHSTPATPATAALSWQLPAFKQWGCCSRLSFASSPSTTP